MSTSTTMGVAIGFAVVTAAALGTLDEPSILFNPAGFSIVVGGTVAAAMVAFSPRQFLRLLAQFGGMLGRTNDSIAAEIEQISRVARCLTFRTEYKTLGRELAKVRDPFLHSAFQMVIDDEKTEDIADRMGWHIQQIREREQSEANMFRTLASFAPAFGMFGTLLGLANMLQTLSYDPTQIGTGMAIALITTMYGVLLSNLVFKPMALRLERLSEGRIQSLRIMLEGVLLMNERRSPSAIRETLRQLVVAPSETEEGRRVAGARSGGIGAWLKA